MSFPRLVSNKTPMRLLLIAAAVMANCFVSYGVRILE